MACMYVACLLTHEYVLMYASTRTSLTSYRPYAYIQTYFSYARIYTNMTAITNLATLLLYMWTWNQVGTWSLASRVRALWEKIWRISCVRSMTCDKTRYLGQLFFAFSMPGWWAVCWKRSFQCDFKRTEHQEKEVCGVDNPHKTSVLPVGIT